jgi:hypothetical protein
MLAGEVHCLCLMCGGAQILTDKRMDDQVLPLVTADASARVNADPVAITQTSQVSAERLARPARSTHILRGLSRLAQVAGPPHLGYIVSCF